MKICPINTISTGKYLQNKKSQNIHSYEGYNVSFESKKRLQKLFTRKSYVPAMVATAFGTVSAANVKSREDVLPSREEFKKMLNENPIQKNTKLNEYCVEEFLKGYDINPEYALKFYNMKRSDGTLLRDLQLYNTSISKLFFQCIYGRTILKYTEEYPDNTKRIEDKYKFLQQLIDLKAPSGYI